MLSKLWHGLTWINHIIEPYFRDIFGDDLLSKNMPTLRVFGRVRHQQMYFSRNLQTVRVFGGIRHPKHDFF